MSSTSFGTSNVAVKMYDGTHVNGSSSSTGSYYNARVANVLTASETVVVQDYTYNVCAKNWTLPTESQYQTVKSYSSSFAPTSTGYYKGSTLTSKSSGHWWSRTAHKNTDFRDFNYSGGSYSVGNGDGLYIGQSARCMVI